jgi:hypothetical protein
MYRAGSQFWGMEQNLRSFGVEYGQSDRLEAEMVVSK